jgi:hypothetical protein
VLILKSTCCQEPGLPKQLQLRTRNPATGSHVIPPSRRPEQSSIDITVSVCKTQVFHIMASFTARALVWSACVTVVAAQGMGMGVAVDYTVPGLKVSDLIRNKHTCFLDRPRTSCSAAIACQALIGPH